MWLPWTPTPWVTLSTITGWPSRSVSLLPSVRDTMSGLPPGAVGMMMRSGRVGHAGLWAKDGDAIPEAVAPYRNVLRVNGIFSLPSRSNPRLGVLLGILGQLRAAIHAFAHCYAACSRRPAHG